MGKKQSTTNGGANAPPGKKKKLPKVKKYKPKPKPTCKTDHYGEAAVKVGSYTVHLGGTRYFQAGDLDEYDLIVPLDPGRVPLTFGKEYAILAAHLQDFGGVPENWGEFLEKEIIPELREGSTLLAYCIGSHGRTGTFLASLIALLEPRIKDPILTARRRHCRKAVETRAQAEAVFALRGEPLPERYVKEFPVHRPVVSFRRPISDEIVHPDDIEVAGALGLFAEPED